MGTDSHTAHHILPERVQKAWNALHECLDDYGGKRLREAMNELSVAIGEAWVQRPSAASETRRTTDTARMDWLERQSVEVRTPLVHGSRHDFTATSEDQDGHEEPSDIRAQIDARIKDETIQPQPASAPCVAAPFKLPATAFEKEDGYECCGVWSPCRPGCVPVKRTDERPG